MFLIGDEVSAYPIDFKERYGIDYSLCPVKPFGIREINKLIWHTQLSTHNGGDFFNEIFDDHPNLLALTSIMFHSMEEMIEDWRKNIGQAKSSKEAAKELIKNNNLSPRVIRELLRLQDPTDKGENRLALRIGMEAVDDIIKVGLEKDSGGNPRIEVQRCGNFLVPQVEGHENILVRRVLQAEQLPDDAGRGVPNSAHGCNA